MRQLADTPGAIIRCQMEKQSGALSAFNLQAALEALHADDLLVLGGVVKTQHVDHVGDVVMAETKGNLESARRGEVYNQDVQSDILQYAAISRSDCLFSDVFFHLVVVQVASA